MHLLKKVILFAVAFILVSPLFLHSVAFAAIPGEDELPTSKRYDVDPETGKCAEYPDGRYANIFNCLLQRVDFPDAANPLDTCPQWEDFKTDPCIVTQKVAVVEAVFDNVPLDESKEVLVVCLKNDIKNCTYFDMIFSSSSNVEIQKKDFGLVKVTFPTLCGDGKNKLKGDCDDDGSDWFWVNSTYRITLFKISKEEFLSYEANKQIIKTPPTSPGFTLLQSGAFYVYHSIPKVEVLLTKIGNPGRVRDIHVTLTGRNTGKESTNSYYVNLYGPSQTGQESLTEKRDDSKIGSSGCLYIGPTSESGKFTIETPPLIPGKYYIKIRAGKNLNINPQIINSTPTCSPDNFTYFHIPLEITEDENGRQETSLGDPFVDPYGIDNPINLRGEDPKVVCSDEDKENGYCTKIATGLGTKISTIPQKFIGNVMSILLSIGGIVAIAFFIQAGYTIMTSAGNKEKIGQAREQIIAAVMGLMFIILSVAILEFIGVNILRIPGFGN